MEEAPQLDYAGLLAKFRVRENTAYDKNNNIGYECVNNCDNFSFTGEQNRISITRSTVNELKKQDRYFQVIGRAEDHGARANPYIQIEIKEKITNRIIDGEFGLTQRMNNFEFKRYPPDERHAQGGSKRRRTKKLKKSKRRRSSK